MKRDFMVFYSPFVVINLVFILLSLNVEVVELNALIKKTWQETMTSAIDITTLGIIVNNLFVAAYLWVLPIYLMWIAFKNARSLKEKQNMLKLVYFVYLSYFIKETLTVSLSLFGFQRLNVTYLYSFLTLIMPHGLTEIGALALTAAFATQWMSSLINKDKFELPPKEFFLIPATLIIFSGILETTLTPFLFRSFL